MKKQLLILLLLCSCSNPTTETTSLSSVIKNIRNDLQNTNTIAVNNYSTWTIQQKEIFDENISELQCQTNSPDPIIPIINNNFTLNVTGSFTKSGQFGISTTQLTKPNISFSGSLSKTDSQQISVPVNFVALSLLPYYEMNKKMSLNQYLYSSNKSDDNIVKNEEQNLIKERNDFTQHIQFLINSYSKQYCLRTNYNNNSSFMTLKKSN